MDTYHIERIDCSIIENRQHTVIAIIYHVFYKNPNTKTKTVFGTPNKTMEQYMKEAGQPVLKYKNKFGTIWTWKRQDQK